MYPIKFPHQLDHAAFLEQFWQKKALYMPAAWSEFDNPLSAEELAGLALDAEIPSRIVEQHADQHWSVRQGPFTELDFAELEGKTWSLLVTDVEKHLPDFVAYVAPFRFIPDWRFDDLMISYAPPGGSVGPHMDDYDVFLIQAEGQRRWQLEGHFRELPQAQHTLIKDTDLRLINDYQVKDEFLCNPGDMLYLPPRLGHFGVATTDCMTWSIGFKAPSFQDMLVDYLDHFETVNEHKRFADPGLELAAHAGEISPNQISQLKQWFMSQFEPDDEVFVRWLGQFLTRSAQVELPLPHQHELADLPRKLEQNPFYRFDFIRLEGRTWLYVGGEEYAVSETFAQQACSKGVLSVSRIPVEDSPVLRALFNKGCLLEAGQHD